MASRTVKIRDLERTRGKILAHAERIFAAKGFAGTSIAMIAEAAGFHKRRLHYCFGSKEQLYKAVVLHSLPRFSKIISEMPEDLPSLLIYWHRVFRRSSPLAMRFIAWESLDTNRKVTGQRAQLYDLFQAKLRHAQREGNLPQDLDIGQIHMAISALAIFPYVFPKLCHLMTGMRPNSKRFDGQQVDFLARLGTLLSRGELARTLPVKCG